MDPALLETLGPVGIGLASVVALGLSLWWARRGGRASAEEHPPPGAEDASKRPSGRWFDALRASRDAFSRWFGGPIDVSALDGLEDALLLADVGPVTADRLLDGLRTKIRAGETDPARLRLALREAMLEILGGVRAAAPLPSGLAVVLIVGVNGSGKTTTIGKLAHRFRQAGKSVLLAAGDTYRAAAADQLEVWATRSGAVIVRGAENADPASVAHSAVDQALTRGGDVVLVDTAGRLQTAKPLMDQLGKVRRVIDKRLPGAPHATWLVIDGTMGQNALAQARTFHEATPLTGVVVTKLDGTAKGGIVLAIAAELKVPVVFVGLGEKIDDLREFDAEAFVDSLVGVGEG
jgi:fused signal recognition particle receptor